MKKHTEVFVPPEGTRAIRPTKGERQRYISDGAAVRNPPLSPEDGARLLQALRNTRKEASK